MSIMLLIALSASPSVNVSTPKTIRAPQLSGGSTITVQSGGRILVRDPEGNLRWTVQTGSPVDHIVTDAVRIFVASGSFVRTFQEGVAGWALDMGSSVQALQLVPDGLQVRLAAGNLYVHPERGRICTPRDPCGRTQAHTVGSIGVPFLDLPGLGYPGLGLLINPQLFDSGDHLRAMVPPGRMPGWGMAPLAPKPPEASALSCIDGGNCADAATPSPRSISVGNQGVQMRKDLHGKVRGIQIGVGAPRP